MRIVYACLALVIPVASLNAGVMTFDNPGDVVLSPTQAPGVWYTDRYAPATFESGATGGSRTGVLYHEISADDDIDSRPSDFDSAFRNTQGRKFDLNPGATTLYVDLYIDGAWATLDQTEDTDGRLASLWGTGDDGSFPIIEFNNLASSGSGGFRIWDSDSGTWMEVSGFTGYDDWYRIGFELTGATYDYSVNGTPVLSDPGSASSLNNVILQGYNDGESYDIFWDNLESNGIAAAIPEPASIWLMTLGGIAFAGFGLRRRRNAAVANTSD